MSVSYHSYTVIGIEIDPKSLYKDRESRACDCDFKGDINNPPNFCDHCGEKFIETENWPIDGYHEDNEFLGFDIAYNTDRERERERSLEKL